MHLAVLGSSSAGNCTAVWEDGATLLIDCGFHHTFLEASLRRVRPGAPAITGVLITHIHGDHLNPLSLGYFLRLGIPVIAPRRLLRIMERRLPAVHAGRERNLLREAGAGGIEVGPFEVRAFPVPHDSPGGCFGYSVRSGSPGNKRTISLATDLGNTEEGLEEWFTDAHAIVIESNHDETMLENSGRPEWLKRRIRETGHLSNRQCAGFVSRVFERSKSPARTVVLAHISQECNTNALAVYATRSVLDQQGFGATRVIPVFPSTATEVVHV